MLTRSLKSSKASHILEEEFYPRKGNSAIKEKKAG